MRRENIEEMQMQEVFMWSWDRSAKSFCVRLSCFIKQQSLLQSLILFFFLMKNVGEDEVKGENASKGRLQNQKWNQIIYRA